MQTALLTTSAVAELCRRDKTRIYEVFNTPECQPWLPAKRGVGEGRAFDADQALFTMIHGDLTNWGLSVPFAGRVVCRIKEALAEEPNAPRLVIAFHEIGVSFFYAINDDDGPSRLTRTDNGAGPARFRVVLDLSTYRAAICAALRGVEDVAA